MNIEKLTAQTPAEIRTRVQRRQQGMFPLWLATNHFCGEGFWFWVIPLHGVTSLGLVYDRTLFDAERVSSPRKLIEWACQEFPLFERDLPRRRVLDSARLPSYAYDCMQTLSHEKWAISGMAGRFSDPLYSPGSDLIAYYNSLIVDTILSKNGEEVRRKCELYEPLMKVFYQAYVPSYAVSYDVLGSQEVFNLKYSWELAVYFSFYVFPFVNDLFTDAAFVGCFLRKFAQLGPINGNLQQFLSGYFQWRKKREPIPRAVLSDFSELTPLSKAEKAFYQIGFSGQEAEEVLDEHLQNLKEFARFVLAYVSSIVVGDEKVLLNQSFVRSIRLKSCAFDPAAIERDYSHHVRCTEQYQWKLDPFVMEKFR